MHKVGLNYSIFYPKANRTTVKTLLYSGHLGCIKGGRGSFFFNYNQSSTVTKLSYIFSVLKQGQILWPNIVSSELI